jgi:hypothetical protein
LCCVLGAPSPCLAQGPSERPAGGLFGGRSGSSDGQRLDLSATLLEAYDDNLLAEAGSVSPGSPVVSGFFTMLQMDGRYRWANSRIDLGVSGGSAFRYDTYLSDVRTISGTAGVGLGIRIGRATRFSLNQGAAYSPSYLFALFPSLDEAAPGDAPVGAPDYASNDASSYSYASTARLTHGLTRRVSWSVDADYSYTDVTDPRAALDDTRSYGVRTGLSRNLSRYTALRGEYEYRTGEMGSAFAGPTSEHGIQIGVDRRYVLSATRQAGFDISVGVSRVQGFVGVQSRVESVAAANDAFYRLNVDANGTYQFGRSWQARAAYTRGVEYVPELTEPVFVDSFNGTVTGLLSRRVDLGFNAGYSRGASVLSTASPFDSYTASVRSRIAATETIALQLEYLYYFYDFHEGALLAPGLPPRLERNGIRAGVTFWIPALGR